MRKKILLVGSSGGHLLQMLRVESVMGEYVRVWVCFRKPDAEYFLAGKKVYWCYFPTTRNLWNLARNTFQAIYVLLRERPLAIVSSGAGTALPYFYLGKLMGCRTIFVEAYNRINTKSLTGRLVYPISDLFCVQWDSMQALYKKSVVIGPLP